jgi:lipid-binding SYLF domain-containing protein
MLAGIILMLMSFVCNSVEAGGGETNRVKAATEVFTEIMAISEKDIADSLMEDTYGIAVIPGTIKAGYILGGRHGSGIMVVRNKEGKWSAPCFVTFTGGSIGFQIGVQSTDIILVFKNRRGLDNIMWGKFTLGADAAIALGPLGRQVELGTDARFEAEIYSYSRSRGLFAGLSFEATALQIDDEANVTFYNARPISPNDIFNNKYEAPAAAKEFMQLLEKHSSK